MTVIHDPENEAANPIAGGLWLSQNAPIGSRADFGAVDRCGRLLCQTPLSSCAGLQHEAHGDYSLARIIAVQRLEDSVLSCV